MAAVVVQRGRAVPEMLLVSLAPHVVAEDGAGAAAEGAVGEDPHSPATAQLAAHDVPIGDIPPVVTHRPPDAPLLQLHAALAPAAPAGQTHQAMAWGDTGDRWPWCCPQCHHRLREDGVPTKTGVHRGPDPHLVSPRCFQLWRLGVLSAPWGLQGGRCGGYEGLSPLRPPLGTKCPICAIL